MTVEEKICETGEMVTICILFSSQSPISEGCTPFEMWMPMQTV